MNHTDHFQRVSIIAVVALAGLTAASAAPTEVNQTPRKAELSPASTKYRSLEVRGVEIAYREAGDPSDPTVVLFHGFPTSSHMFRELIPRLSSKYHVLAPDYPGFGASEMPAPSAFEYSFANLTDTMAAFLEAKQVRQYTLYAMDYGAPVAFRLFAKHPKRVTGFVIQNGNAYEEGLQEFWDPLRAYWAEPTDANANKLRPFLEFDAQRWQYTHGVPKEALALVAPDNWYYDQYLLDRPGAKEIQLLLFKSYGTNPGEYPKWQAAFRRHQPPALLVWGVHDHIFPPAGAHPYRKDLKDLEFHLLDAGHFVLETHLDFVAERMIAFLNRTTTSSRE